jgi:hypothetical protein
LLREAQGENILSTVRVFEWQKRFAEGREDVEDDEGPDCRLTMKTDENFGTERTLMRTDRCLGIKMMAEELSMDKETVRQLKTSM